MNTEELKTGIRRILDEQVPPEAKLQAVCDVLRSEVADYHWVGYYLVDADADSQLILGPFSGKPTEHTRIDFGEGICGQAASSMEVFVVDDVNAESNYLSCSPDVRSEFVAPVINRGRFVGELDLDSHTTAAFSQKDSELLKWVAEVTAEVVAGAAGLEG